MGTPIEYRQYRQILSLEVKKAGKKRLEFFKIGGTGGTAGESEERILEHE